MFKRIVASFLSIGTVTAGMWYFHSPRLGSFCSPVPYTVERLDRNGNMVTITFGGDAQRKGCELVKNFPA